MPGTIRSVLLSLATKVGPFSEVLSDLAARKGQAALASLYI